MGTMKGDVRRRNALTLALAVTCAPIVGCGGTCSNEMGSDGGSTKDVARPQDTSVPESGSKEASGDSGHPQPDAGAPDASPDCGAVPPSGTQLVAIKDPVTVLGLTGDGYAVYLDTNAESLSAVAITGGTAKAIGASTSQSGTLWTHAGGVLFLPAPANPVTGICPLSAWTAASGSHAISTSAFGYDGYYYTYDVDSSGAYVAYFATTDGISATLTISSIDGATQKAIATNIDLTNYSCPPMVQFSGETLLTNYCFTAGTSDAGGLAVVAAFAGPSFTGVPLGTAPPSGGPMVSVNPAGTQALVTTSPGLVLYPIAGGSGIPVDPTGTGGSFTANGDIVYTTTAGALKRYSATSGMTITLVPSGMNFLLALSPDGNWAHAGQKEDSSSGLTDLYLASATTPGSATQLWAKTTAASMGFSADSTYSAFGVNFPMIFGAIPFDIEASPVAGGTPAVASESLSSPLFTTGTKLLINDNVTKATGAADIVSIDLAAASAKKTLVAQADPNYFLGPTDQLVYSWHCNAGATSGVWTVATP
jgi:VCBS repeat-containing protein